MEIFHNLQLATLYPEVLVQASVYIENGNTALSLLDPYTGETIAHASVNVLPLTDYKTVLIKDWGENEGVFSWLIENNILEPCPSLDTSTGYVVARGAQIIHEELLLQAQTIQQEWMDSITPFNLY